MANLTDTSVNGDLRVTGTMFGTQAGNYATCATAAGTAAKAVTIRGFTLTTGIHVFVKFTVTNTAAVASLTLNVSGTGAKSMKYRGGNLPAVGTLSASRVYEFIYDGTNWELVGDLDTNTQTVTGVKGNAESSYRTGQVNLTAYTSARTPASHTHGNIANGGTLTDTAAAAAGNDYVVIRDADNSKIQTSTIKGTDVADAVSKKHSHSTLTLSTTAQAYDGSHTLALPSTDPYTSARTPTSHTHGNITNGGALQTNDITIASGDKLVVTDSSDSSKVARASISFDGSTTTQALTKAGTWATFNNYSHPAGSAASKTGVPTADATPSFGGTFKVNQITTDATSHVSAVTERTITIPGTTATTSAKGLMSAADKTKLNNEPITKNTSDVKVFCITKPITTNWYDNRTVHLYTGYVNGTGFELIIGVRQYSATTSAPLTNLSVTLYRETPYAITITPYYKVDGSNIVLAFVFADKTIFRVTSPVTDMSSNISTLDTWDETGWTALPSANLVHRYNAWKDTTSAIGSDAIPTYVAAGGQIKACTDDFVHDGDVTSTYSSTGTSPVNGTAVAAAIGGLDVSSVGGDGKYISAISETDGKISATATTMDTTPTASSTKAVTSGGIKTALDGKVSKSGDTMTGRLTLQKPLSQVITGTGTAAVTTSPYYPARWKYDLGIANPTAGDRLVIKIPCAGHDNGVFISTDNGTTYYPVARHTGANRLATHYPNGAYICVVFESYVSGNANAGEVDSVYPPSGGTTRQNYTSGCWRVINDYDANGFVCGYCSTAAGTAAKVVSATNYSASVGNTILVRFTNTNSAAGALTLNAGDVTKTIKWNGTVTASGTTSAIPAGTWPCYYDGTYWNVWTNGAVQGNSYMGGLLPVGYIYAGATKKTWACLGKFKRTGLAANAWGTITLMLAHGAGITGANDKYNIDNYLLTFQASAQDFAGKMTLLNNTDNSSKTYVTLYTKYDSTTDTWILYASSATDKNYASYQIYEFPFKANLDSFRYIADGSGFLDEAPTGTTEVTGYISALFPKSITTNQVVFTDGTTGKLKTNTSADACNLFINALSTGTSTPTDNDYYVSQYVGGGTTTTSYHRRPMSALWTYIKGKLTSVSGVNISGNAATATKINTGAKIGDTNKPVYIAADGTVTPISYTIATSVPSGAVFTDTKVTSSANHYAPETASGSDKTASASGGTAAWSLDVVKGVTINTDGKGHITGLSVTSGKLPSNPNTDTKQRIVASDSKSYLTGVTTAPTSSNQDLTGVANTNVYATAGQLHATTFDVNSKCTLQFNTTTNALDFVFA